MRSPHLGASLPAVRTQGSAGDPLSGSARAASLGRRRGEKGQVNWKLAQTQSLWFRALDERKECGGVH